MRGILPASLAFLATIAAPACQGVTAQSTSIPTPKVDVPLAAKPTVAKLTVAGGCFWGVEAVFEHVRGVSGAISGYAGGTADSATYDIVSSGRTRHAESVEITYDASRVTLGQLLQVFFSVAHDPTEVDKQGPDHGPQYRSVIFFASPDQERVARAYIAQLDAAKVFRAPIATEVTKLDRFYPAEPDHQDFAARYPQHPYIRAWDAPKVAALRVYFPDWYKER
jgi:peptide-methionine (S)-S-oxide reductase